MIDIKVPELSESVSEATLLAWAKQVGDAVSEGEVLVEIETDKITMEIYAPANGVLQAIHMQEGSDVTSGQLLAQILEGGAAESGAGQAAPAAPASASEQPSASASTSATPPPPAAAGEPVASPSARKIASENAVDLAHVQGTGKGGRITKGDVLQSGSDAAGSAAASEAGDEGDLNAMPAAVKLANKHGVDLASVTGTGRGGRIKRRDVLDALQGARQPAQPPSNQAASKPQSAAAEPVIQTASSLAAAASSTPATASAPATSALTPTAGEARQDRRVAMTKLRMRIAERLLQSQQTTATLTTFNEVNMQAIIDLRKQYRDAFEKKHGVKMGFMSFFVKAAVTALREYPIINASVDGTDIIYHDYYDIGVAVGSKRGLVVPVLRDADVLSFSGIETRIADFGARAQTGALSLDEITGGTFSITNGGVFGSMLSTPIINPPQSAILGIHATKMRAVAEDDGNIVARPMCYFALSYDHRIIDGREAVLFLVAVKDALEDPMRLLIEI